MRIVTLAERKAAAVAAKVAAVEAVRLELGPVANSLGGRFLLFGSAARDELRYDSDVDLLLDFPDEATTSAAWSAAEQACAKHKLSHDIMPVSWCKDAFLQHVLPQSKPIP